MMTTNERAMVIELAKAVSHLSSALQATLSDSEKEKDSDLTRNLHAVKENITEVIRLVDQEWLPK